jgi:HD-like signal output (HDOD) protein
MHTQSILGRFWAWLSGTLPPPSVISRRVAPASSGKIENVPVPIPGESPDYRQILLERIAELDGLIKTDGDQMALDILQRMVERKNLELPRLPDLAMQLLQLDLNGPENSHQIATLIRQDRDMAACVMEAARFGDNPASTLEHAIIRLGLPTVQGIAIGTSTHAVIYRIPGFNAESRKLAARAMVCARTCQRLARSCRQEPGAAFLSGLFHDVGHVLLLRALSTVRARTRGGGVVSADLVKELRHRLHVPLGAWFAEMRGLPDQVCDAIAFHHMPVDGLSGIVWAVQALQENYTVGNTPDRWEEVAPPVAVVRAAMGITNVH